MIRIKWKLYDLEWLNGKYMEMSHEDLKRRISYWINLGVIKEIK